MLALKAISQAVDTLLESLLVELCEHAAKLQCVVPLAILLVSACHRDESHNVASPFRDYFLLSILPLLPASKIPPTISASLCLRLLGLNPRVDVDHEDVRAVERHAAQHQGNPVGSQQGVQEEEGTLHEACHCRLKEEVYAVRIEEGGHSTTTAEGSPHPAMILCIEVEIGEQYSHGASHQEKHAEGQQQDAVQEVNPWSPNRIENVVQLNVDGTEWQKTCSEDLRDGALVPPT